MYNISKLVIIYFKTASSSLSAQRLSNFKLLPTISQHQFTSFIVFPLSRQKLSNLYVAERALALLVPIFALRSILKLNNGADSVKRNNNVFILDVKRVIISLDCKR